jgi:hypothetical protein
MQKTSAFAILASVPEIHLISGLEAIAVQLDAEEPVDSPRIVLGSMAFELFRKADELRGDRAVEMLIYATEAKGDQPLNPEVAWRGLYVQHVPSRNGRYRGNLDYRPKSTASDRAGWAVFWEMAELEQIKKPIPIGSLRGLGQKTNCKPRFIPEEPILIEYPG